MDKGIQDATMGTVGWFAFAAGTVGLTAGQTLRVGIVNIGSFPTIILCGVFQNPHPVSLLEDSHRLGPGEAVNCDLKASDLSKEIFDKSGRVQVRPFVQSSSRTVCANLEVFDDKTGKTSIILSLQEAVHRA